MDNCNKVLIFAALVVGGVVLYKTMKKRGEPYKDIFMAKDVPNDEFISRPHFEAQLAPRLDPFRNGQYDKLNGYLPNVDMQATPVNPLGNGSFPIMADKVDYAKMGTSDEIAVANADCAMAKLKKYDGMAQNNGSSEKFSMNFSGSNGGQNGELRKSSPMNNQALEYLSPKDLLPQADMASVLSKDPSDPNVYMFDRTLFSPLKRRNLNNVDFIRGDLPIARQSIGWFDSASNPGTDLMVGSVQSGIIGPSMEERTEMQDLVYTRYDHEYPLQSEVVSGDMENRFI